MSFLRALKQLLSDSAKGLRQVKEDYVKIHVLLDVLPTKEVHYIGYPF